MMKPLRNVLRLNATTCIAFGLLFLIAPTAVGTFLGSVPDLVIQIVGFALIFNGGHLIITSRRAQINPSEVYYFAAGDILWFIGSLGKRLQNLDSSPMGWSAARCRGQRVKMSGWNSWRY